MKKLFLKTAFAGFLLTLLSGPALTKCADVMLQEPDHTLLPVIDQPSETLHPVIEPVVIPSQEPESASSSGIDATYAVKNLLSSIMETFPHLTVQEALSQSALLGIISETDVQLHMYGTFTTKPDPKKPDRTMRIFDTDTTHSTTPINKIARSMLDVLDGKLRSTVQESNPFCALEGAIIAQIMQTLTTGEDGIDKLAKLLKNPTLITAWSNDWDEQVNPRNDDGTYVQKDPKKKYSLSEFKEKIKDFVKLLEALNKEAKTTSEKEKNISELSKIFMTFLAVKDQKQKATGESHAIKEYYTTLLGEPFENEHYTTQELEQIIKTLLDEDYKHRIDEDAKGLEDTTACLAHFQGSDLAPLEAPFGRYTSPEKSFAYCAEATVRSIMNSILYNPETGKLDVGMLPLNLQKKMKTNKKFLTFIEKYPDPTAINYYGNSLEDWLKLVSGLDGVVYKNETDKDAYEISASAGPKNLVAVLNHIFGTDADSFESLATALEVKDKDNAVVREISFTPIKTGFDLEVSYHERTIIEGIVGSEVDTGHATFTIKSHSIIDLLKDRAFHTIISKLSDLAKQNLYGLIFKPSTLNRACDGSTPLLLAISRYPEIAKIMLTFGADPNFKGNYDKTPLEEAIGKRNNDLVYELVKYGATVNQQILEDAVKTGSLELTRFFISRIASPDYPQLLTKVVSTGNIELTDLFLSRVASPNYQQLLNDAISSGSLDLVKFFVEKKGANVQNSDQENITPLDKALQEYDKWHLRLKIDDIIEFLIEKGAVITQKNLERAAQLNDEKLITLLLSYPKDTSYYSEYPNYNQLLKITIKTGSIGTITLLLNDGADINTRNEEGISLLDNALNALTEKYIRSIDCSFIKLLLERGAIVTQKNLDSAIKLRNKELTEILQNAYSEQSFGLNLTTQEQRCITECVTEAM